MFDEPLPKKAEPRKLAAKEAYFKASLNLEAMPRLASAVHEGLGKASVELEFGMDDQRHRLVTGKVDCETAVLCQRCLKPVDIVFGSQIKLGIVWDEEDAKQLPRALDPWIVGEQELVDLNEVVEEELLLSMPFVSYHNVEQCSGAQHYESPPPAAEAEVVEEKKQSPFGVLEQLKGPSGKPENFE